jgi:hypothetical protein
MRKRLFTGDPDPNQMYTESALEKFGTRIPTVPPTEYIRSLQSFLTAFGDEEGKARMVYSQLSEHSHPTLLSVVHGYTKDVPPTPTSAGLISNDTARRAYITWSLAQMMLLCALWESHIATGKGFGGQ